MRFSLDTMGEHVTVTRWTYLLFAVLALCACRPIYSATGDTVVYTNDFETTAGSEWSQTNRDVTPVGTRSFLGQFNNGTVTLSLDNLPEHQKVRISFDLFVIESWDGNTTEWDDGPDYWGLSVQEGPQLLYTTFSNCDGDYGYNRNQAFPDWHPVGNHKAMTGSIEQNSLGYPRFGDAVYHFTYTFPHTADAVAFDFSAAHLQDIYDESWGLDNVEVAIKDEPINSGVMLEVANLADQNFALTAAQETITGIPVTYVMKITNTGEGNDQFRIVGPAGGTDFSITYTDAVYGGNPITADVSPPGTGWITPILPAGQSMIIRVDVALGASFDFDGAYLGIEVVATSMRDDSLDASVTATTSRGIKRVFNPAVEFAPIQNPNGVWSYGWQQTLGNTFNLYTDHFPTDQGLNFWHLNTDPHVGYNATDQEVYRSGVHYIPGRMSFAPGPANEYSVVRWTAPGNGTVQINAKFTGLSDIYGQTTTDVHILLNGTELYGGYVDGYNDTQTAECLATVTAGDVVDFAVGNGDGWYGDDPTGLDATIAFQQSITYQHDLLIKNDGGEYVGGGIRNGEPGQTTSQSVISDSPAVYFLKVVNEGTTTDTYTIQAAWMEDPRWTVRIIDPQTGLAVTTEVRNGIWKTNPLGVLETQELRVEVIPNGTVYGLEELPITFTSTSDAQAAMIDRVGAITGKAPLTGVNLTFTPEIACPLGTSVTLTATPNGGGPVEYQFQIRTGQRWVSLTPFRRAGTYPWTALAPGTYRFRVLVREIGRPATQVVSVEETYTVTLPLVLALTKTVTPAPYRINKVITVAASAIGGARVQYTFTATRLVSGRWIIVDQSVQSDSPTWTWTPESPGMYQVNVTATDISVNRSLNGIPALLVVN